MIKFSNGGVVVESHEELPELPMQIDELFLDFETTSGDPRLTSLDPWHDCKIAGYAFTWDDMPCAYYVPVRHAYGKCLDYERAMSYLKQLITRSKRWVNHNVKYDMMVYHVELGPLPSESDLECVCTVVQSKILDSDRGYGRGTYGLDSLSADWLGRDISHYEHKLQPYLSEAHNKDYGLIPVDIVSEYACEDALTGRRLYRRGEDLMHSDCRRVWSTERRLTRVLYEMETRGIIVDPTQLKVAELHTLTKMLKLEESLSRLVGRVFNPASGADVYDVLCNRYGMPVLSYTNVDDEGEITESSSPSFDKHALALYAAHPDAPAGLVEGIIQYRQWSTYKGLFVEPWQELHVDGVLHPNHNQCVRTGRMSCKNPNTQQCNKDAKGLVLCRPGYVLADFDYSQIEYRTMVHYMQDERLIKAYLDDPDMDYHAHVAQMCGIKRRPAKTVNFMIGFGGGKKKTRHMLSINPDVVAEARAKVARLIELGEVREEHRVAEVQHLCETKATQIHERYHDEMPRLKPTSHDVSKVCRARGYVRNAYGRHRHLPREHSHKAFNNINQSSAADICKDRTVALYDATRGTGIELLLNVHDSIVCEIPKELLENPRTLQDALDVLEHPAVQLRVPIRAGVGVSEKSWREAASDEARVKVERKEHCPSSAPFDHLRRRRERDPALA